MVYSTQKHTKLVLFQQVEGITVLKLQHNLLGHQLNPPEAEHLCSDMINTSPTVSSAVAV